VGHEDTRTADTTAVVMARTVIGLHQAVLNACPRVHLDAGEQPLQGRVQASAAPITWKADETAERPPFSEVIEEPLLCRWEEFGQVVEGETDSDPQARLEPTGR
jgi:hypothetical protein